MELAHTLTSLEAKPRTWTVDRPLVIGRSDQCEIVLQSSAVSRQHARVAPAAGCVSIVDLGSSNGVFLDGIAIGDTSASVGARLRIGDAIFVVGLAEPASAVTAEADDALVGGASLEAIRRTLRLVGPTDLPVMLLGETGTGKEVAARRLHVLSGRRGQFVAVNVAAVPATMFENEVFGHTIGAFTGATRAQKGLFEVADSGTLFLDEVGDLAMELQAKLLRVLEDGKVRPVGGTQETTVNTRVVCATNRDLGLEVAAGRFRADLFARLSTVVVQLPPLRSRLIDLPMLVTHLAARRGHGSVEIEPDALDAMALHGWPQNVRELDNCVKTATLYDARTVRLEHLPATLRDGYVRPGDRLRDVATPGHGSPASRVVSNPRTRHVAGPKPRGIRPTREQLLAALANSRANLRKTAEALGISRAHLYRVIAEEGLSAEDARAAGMRLAETQSGIDASSEPETLDRSDSKTAWKPKPS